jgi:ubiquinone/menaquinone biosynthesis C-methylase UbiE
MNGENDVMNEIKEPPHPRTLDNEIPELIHFLKPGMDVLDIGCGFGTITLGVAEVVKPGKVVGLDPGNKYIDRAREWAAVNPQTDNLTFQVGDSLRLEFPDNTRALLSSSRWSIKYTLSIFTIA